MKRFGYWGVFSIVVLFFVVPINASAMGVEGAVGIWWQDPSGDVGFRGESLDVKNELRYSSEAKIFGRLKVDMPLFIPNIYLMATPIKYEEVGSKDTSFTFGDVTFSGNVPFSSKLKLDHYDVALYYGIPFLRTATLGVLNIEIGLNGRIIDFKGEINQPSTGISESESFTLPIPMLYLGAQLKPIKYLSLEVEARGVAYSSNEYYDLIGRLKLELFSSLFIAGGYRYEKAKIDYSDVKANIKIGGPFLELGFVF